jgi:hypothetical protein
VLRATGVADGTTLTPGSTGVIATIEVNSTGVWAVSYAISARAVSPTIVLYSVGVNGGPASVPSSGSNPSRTLQSCYGTANQFETVANSSILNLNSGDLVSLLISTTSASSVSVDITAATLHVERIK